MDFSGGRYKSKSALSVRTVDYCLSLPQTPANRAPSAVTLATSTPGRRMLGRSVRELDQDMAALRASRQDNPYLQAVVTKARIASRESLDDCLDDEGVGEDSDDAGLVAREWATGSTTSTVTTPRHLNLDPDYCEPLAIAELHEHLIRSPPPVPWPPSSPAHRHFQFPGPGSPTPSHHYGAGGCYSSAKEQRNLMELSEGEDNGNGGMWEDDRRALQHQSSYSNSGYNNTTASTSSSSSSSASQVPAALRSPRPFGILRVGVGAGDSGAEDAVHLMADSS